MKKPKKQVPAFPLTVYVTRDEDNGAPFFLVQDDVEGIDHGQHVAVYTFSHVGVVHVQRAFLATTQKP